MALYALDNLDDAVATTRNLLTPVERGRWLRLALVVFFVGGIGSNALSWSFGGNGNGTPPDQVPTMEVEPWVWVVVAAAVVGALLLGLAFVFVGSVMEFVFVESLRNERVTVRRYWRRRWRQGVRLFAFRLGLGLLLFVGALLLFAPLLAPLVGVGSLGIGILPVALLVLVPLFVLVGLVVAVVHSFTTAFVVPIMILDGVGVIEGWRRLWPTITAHWRQYLAYAVASLLLSLLGGMAVGIATILVVLLLLLPFGLLAAVGVGLFFVFPPAGVLAFVAIGILFVAALIVTVALAQVPVKTYLRYYALLVLGDVEPTFDLVPDQRAAVRGTDSATESDPGPEDGENR